MSALSDLKEDSHTLFRHASVYLGMCIAEARLTSRCEECEVEGQPHAYRGHAHRICTEGSCFAVTELCYAGCTR